MFGRSHLFKVLSFLWRRLRRVAAFNLAYERLYFIPKIFCKFLNFLSWVIIWFSLFILFYIDSWELLLQSFLRIIWFIKVGINLSEALMYRIMRGAMFRRVNIFLYHLVNLSNFLFFNNLNRKVTQCICQHFIIQWRLLLKKRILIFLILNIHLSFFTLWFYHFSLRFFDWLTLSFLFLTCSFRSPSLFRGWYPIFILRLCILPFPWFLFCLLFIFLLLIIAAIFRKWIPNSF